LRSSVQQRDASPRPLEPAAIVATVYNFLRAVVGGVALHLLWGPVFGMAEFEFGVL